ncbi:MAG: phytase [Saprospiraceae bacterium]|nr:phytase [Saprospiraceae bacterium]
MKLFSKIIVFLTVLSALIMPVSAADIVFTCAADGIGDQDDMCIWLHPDDPSRSLIITADKDAWKLFVYNLEGEELNTYDLPHRPGNIDVIYNFPFDGQLIDVVGFNTRSVNNARFGFYKINLVTLGLDSLGYPMTDNWSDELYGFALYRSPNNNAFYAFGSDQSSRIQQYQFFDDGNGGISLEHKRTWQNGSMSFPTEGMVADQENGLLYAANENQGIYVYQADEDQSTDHLRFLGLDPGKLDDDVEGLTIYYAASGAGYLIASSQGENYFSVFERADSNAFIGTFRINGVQDTDGIDLVSSALNENFHAGIFACHNDRLEPQHVELVSWADIADDLVPGLAIDTSYWNPRSQTTRNLDLIEEQVEVRIFPNPTEGVMEINFQLTTSSHVQGYIYDANGKEVAKICNQQFSSGSHTIEWNGTSGRSGLLYFRLRIDNHAIVRMVVIL